MDLAALYSDTQARILELVSPLSGSDLATPIPGTPLWTVRQLLSHLAGGCADLVDGVTEDAGSDPWTERHVVTRQDVAVSDILAEWRARTPALLEMLAIPRQADALAFDLLTHEHDLRGAFGIAGPSDAVAVAGVTTRVTGRLGHMVEKEGLPALRLVNDTGDWVCGAVAGAIGVTGTASTFEWFRALFGRRSAAQILTYDWDGDPATYFGLLNLVGPFPRAAGSEAGAPGLAVGGKPPR
jgi:uncharacterized protein (TIGR03083 family)